MTVLIATVYTCKGCPDCRALTTLLDEEGVSYREVRLDTAEGTAEALSDGMFEMSLPVLQVCGGGFIPRNLLFNDAGLMVDRIKDLFAKFR